MRMINRNISQSEIEEILDLGEVIEDYPHDFPYPSKLILRFVNGRPLHLMLAFAAENGMGIVITVYEPDNAHFESDRKTRKK